MGVDLADDGKILSLQTEGNKLTLFANGGVYLINPSALKRLNDKPHIKSSLENDLLPKFISLGVGLYGFESSGKFIDIGIPEDYYRAKKILKDWFKYLSMSYLYIKKIVTKNTIFFLCAHLRKLLAENL